MTAGQAAGIQSLVMRHGFDDGGVVYVNGREAARINMPAGAISSSTLASTGVEIDALSADRTISAPGVIAGTNRISVEVHQESIGSSDVVFGLELDAVIAGAVPGAAPELAINEVSGQAAG